MSSRDKKRNLRTQGRFSDPSSSASCRNKQKNTDERNKHTRKKNASADDSKEWEPQNSNEIDKEATNSLGEEHSKFQHGTTKVIYQENSNYDFSRFDLPKAPEEIKEDGLKILSTTDFGQSKVYYYPRFLDVTEAFEFYDKFINNINWRQMNVVIRGREYPQPRLVAWFGPFPYAYSGVLLEPQEMTEDILHIKEKMEFYLAKRDIYVNFNSVLLNKYEHGSHSVAWHSDDELSMGIDPTIASISLGITRKFEMRRKPAKDCYDGSDDPPIEYFVNLKNGSLLVMDGVMQVDWQHRVPKEPNVSTPRINLTFRTVYKDDRLCKARK